MKKRTELSEAESRRLSGLKPFQKGQSGNPGGQSKEKRTFIERLTTDDADEVYTALMDLVRERNAPAVLRAWEYIVGKPKEEPIRVVGLNGGPIATVALDPKRLTSEQLRAMAEAIEPDADE